MPASRWNSDPAEILKWLQNEENSIKQNFSDLILQFMAEQQSVEGEIVLGENESGEPTPVSNIPGNLPILPLRGLVAYPQVAVPLTIGQPRSIRLVDDVVVGEKMIGLVTAKDPNLENPGPDDLYRVGTVAVIHRMFRAPDGTIRLLVQGITRFHLDEFTQTEPYLRANITIGQDKTEEGLEVEALARNAREQFSHIDPRERGSRIGPEDPKRGPF